MSEVLEWQVVPANFLKTFMTFCFVFMFAVSCLKPQTVNFSVLKLPFVGKWTLIKWNVHTYSFTARFPTSNFPKFYMLSNGALQN